MRAETKNTEAVADLIVEEGFQPSQGGLQTRPYSLDLTKQQVFTFHRILRYLPNSSSDLASLGHL